MGEINDQRWSTRAANTAVNGSRGFVLDGCARLEAGFRDVAENLRGNGKSGGGTMADAKLPGPGRHNLFRQMHQVPIVPPLLVPSSGNAISNVNDLLGPNTGFHWSVRRLNLSGYSAGTVTVYRNAIQTGYGASFAVQGEIMLPPQQAGTYTFGRGELLLEPDDTMVLVGSGLTLTTGVSGVQVIGSADQFESWLLPDYLM